MTVSSRSRRRRDDSAEPIVLDTHTLLWLSLTPEKISSKANAALKQASGMGAMLVSPISLWEIAMLVRKKRLVLGRPTLEWITDTLDHPGLRVAPISAQVAVDSNELPSGFTSDPADCILIATARTEGATLATRDRLILDYGARGHVKVLAI